MKEVDPIILSSELILFVYLESLSKEHYLEGIRDPNLRLFIILQRYEV